MYGGRLKGKKRAYDEIESNKKHSPPKTPGNPLKTPRKEKPSPSTKTTPKTSHSKSSHSTPKSSHSTPKSSHSTPKPSHSTSKTHQSATDSPQSTLTTSGSVTSAPPGTTIKRIILGQGTNIAIRADDIEDGFMVAQVLEQTSISNPGTEEGDHTTIPIRWFVEGREASLRGSYCFPNWIATVEYGAVLRTVRLSYVPATDMYKIEDDYDSIMAMV